MVVGQKNLENDVLLVMWTTEDGVKMKYHLQDAILPVTSETVNKIKERICDIK